MADLPYGHKAVQPRYPASMVTRKPERPPERLGAASAILGPMLLADLVVTSGRIAATRARSEKVSLLASILKRVEPRQIDTAVAFLSGQGRQGGVGLGPAAVRAAYGGAGRAEPG